MKKNNLKNKFPVWVKEEVLISTMCDKNQLFIKLDEGWFF